VTVVSLSAPAIVPVAQAQTAAELQAQIAALLAQIQALQAQLASVSGPSAAAPSCTFTRDLTVGVTGDDVKCLQQYLNSAGYTVATSGAGSPGNESTFFGSRTKAAVAKWQSANGISPAAGYFGPISRAKYSSLVATAPPTPPAPPSQPQPSPGTGIAVSLATDNPIGKAIPFGANNVEFMKIVLSGSGRIDTMTFTRVGAGVTGDFKSSGVYLLDETGTRLTTGRTVNSTTHKVTFTGLNLNVSGTRTLRLVAAMRSDSSGAGNRNAFEISSASDISGSVGVSGAFPIRGNEFTLTSAGVPGVTVSSSTLPANPKVGEQKARVATIKIENTSSTDDVTLKMLRLRYAGAVSRSNLSNFVLEQAGVKVGSGGPISSNDLLTINFDGNGFLLERGQNRIFDLYADIAPGTRSGSSETIKWYIEDANDVVAVSGQYGYGAVITNNFDSGNSQTMSIEGGQLTITFNGPNAQDVPTNGQDITFLDFTVAAQNNVEVKNLRFSVTTTGMTGQTNEKFTDFKVVDAATGAVIAGPYGSDITTSTTGIVLSDTWNIGAGQSRRLKVKMDVGSASDLNGDTAVVKLVAFQSTDIKNVDSNTDVSTSDIVNNGITGNTMTVKAPSLTISLAGSPSSRTLTQGAQNVDLVGVNFLAVADDITIRTLKVSASPATSGTASASDVITALGTLRIMVGGTQIGQSKALSGSSLPVTAEFTGLNRTIKRGSSETWVINSVGISNSASSTSYVTAIANLATDLVAVDSQGNTLSLSGSVNSDGTVQLTIGTPSLQILRVGGGSPDTDSGMIVANGTRVLTRLQMIAVNGDVTVKKMMFGVSDGATAATAAGLGDEVTTVSLKECTDITCSVKTPVVSDVAIAASGDDAGHARVESPTGFFTIQRGQSKFFTVEGNVANIEVNSTEGADEGTALYASFRIPNFEAISGNTTLTTFATSTGGTALGVTGNAKYVVKAEPVLSVAKPAGASLGNGVVPVIDITVGANGGPIGLKAFGINIAATAATVTAPTTSNVSVIDITGGGSNQLTIGSVSPATAITGGNNGDLYIVLSNVEIITPGSPKTYRVRVTATDVSTTVGAARLVTQLDRNETSPVFATSSVSTSLLSANGAYGSASTRSWVWSDLTISTGGGETDPQWNNGALFRPFPVDAVSVTN